MLFRFNRMSTAEIERTLQSGRGLLPSSPPVLTLEGGPARPLPRGFVHDRSVSFLGSGEREFAEACKVFDSWLHFDLGWVRVLNPQAPLAVGQLIGIEAHTLGLWSVNFSIITEVRRTSSIFGFLYTTTSVHVEEGQERFVLEMNNDGSVFYVIEAVSRPRATLAKIGYPVTRIMQRRFSGHSHDRMWMALTQAAAEQSR